MNIVTKLNSCQCGQKLFDKDPMKTGAWNLPHRSGLQGLASLRIFIVICGMTSFEGTHEHQTHARIPPVMGNVAPEKNVNYDAKR